ncbi:MAG: J domain-containing protein [Hydrogenobaculum sp.]
MKFFGLEELDEDRLKKAYRKMMKEYHPDKVKDKKNITQENCTYKLPSLA